MYLPSHFEENRDAVMHALVRAHPFGPLITREGEEPCADAVPFLIDAARGPHGTLVAHVARANPLWRHAQGQRVLVVFQGPQAYVSPSAYAAKAEHGKVVPTWNYVMVQARGTLRASEDARELHGIVSRLTDTHEAGRAANARSERPTANGTRPHLASRRRPSQCRRTFDRRNSARSGASVR